MYWTAGRRPGRTISCCQRCGTATWEEAYFTYSYSPIRDETGGVAGVFTAVIETTDRVLNERRLRTVRELGDISAVTAPTMQDACDAALAVLARSRADIPFASIYLLDTGGVAQRAAFSGMVDDPRIVPTELDPNRDAEHPVWEVLNAAPAQRPRVLTGLAADYPELFTPTGSPMGDAPPDTAVAIPLVTAGGGDPVGAFFAGVSPYRALDADYCQFFDLVARQVATAIADA
ncbi:MAG: GAF domain-containing protein [Pseudonocardiaceae bacterium]